METPILSGSHLNVTLGNHKILNDVSVSFQAGVMHAILGPNGSGKTTLVRTLCGALSPESGSVKFDGTDLSTMSASCIARRIAIVWQSATAPSDLTVRHLVGYGRYAHTPWWQIRDTSADNHVEQAMDWPMSRASPIDASPLFQAESDRKCGWRRPWHRNPLSLSSMSPQPIWMSPINCESSILFDR